MKFGPTPLSEARGAILAHSLRAGPTMFKKGRVLSGEDLDAMAEAGVQAVIAARLEPGDIGEDAAAGRIAAALMGSGIRAAEAFTGRVNLFAEAHGLLVVDRARLDALNRIDEGLTTATLAPFDVVAPRQMVATIKIIPFALPEGAVARAEALAVDDGPLLRVATFRERAVGLVQTRLPETKESVLDKTDRVIAQRVEALGSRLAAYRRCGHDADSVAAAVRDLRGDGCDVVLIVGASAITDRRDVIPAGIEAAGGTVEHLGMPVDPGNLLLLARDGDGAPLVGLPGCARSPKLNGVDWVLQRLLADVAVTPDDIMAMGAGGLLVDVPHRPLPRAKAARPGVEAVAVSAPRVAALLLAAGQSRRMGRANKLLETVGGLPMVARVADGLRASGVSAIVAVVGHQAEAVRAAIGERADMVVHNPDYGSGLSTSLKRGLAAVPADADAILVCLGDMPSVTAAEIDRLIAAFNPLEGRAICIPTHRGKRGNPVLWDRRFISEMQAIAGDVGARHLLGEHADEVCEVPMDADGVLVDVDTPEALRKLAG